MSSLVHQKIVLLLNEEHKWLQMKHLSMRLGFSQITLIIIFTLDIVKVTTKFLNYIFSSQSLIQLNLTLPNKATITKKTKIGKTYFLVVWCLLPKKIIYMLLSLSRYIYPFIKYMREYIPKLIHRAMPIRKRRKKKTHH